ncbi:MAG TPA: phosphopantetheine-binding protein [Steroidobacteraceae bacterium]|nr:phosphopantetheine-binding protein [Steroidobacteraceae bacterium]
MPSVQDLIGILKDTLQLGERARGFADTTRLLGHVPELDSLAVVNVITALEERFGIVVNDDEISADTFETVGSLHHFLLQKLNA